MIAIFHKGSLMLLKWNRLFSRKQFDEFGNRLENGRTFVNSESTRIERNSIQDNLDVIDLSRSEPFAEGGHRLIFRHPRDDNKTLKINKIIYKKSYFSFFKRRRFDNNREDFAAYREALSMNGPTVHEFIPVIYGFEETSLGAGLVTELVRDYDGSISMTLAQFLRRFGMTSDIRLALGVFREKWYNHKVLSRQLLPHNIVCRRLQNDSQPVLYVVDGLGSPNVIALEKYNSHFRNKKLNRNFDRLNLRMAKELGASTL